MTLKGSVDVTPDGIKKMVAAFKAEGVTKAMLEKKIQRRIDTITSAQMVSLRKIYQSMKDGMSKASDWFEVAGDQGVDPTAEPATDPTKGGN